MIPIVPINAGQVVSGVMEGLDALFTSDEERAAAKLAAQQALDHPHVLQALANIEAAKHSSLLVAGWRPALGWLCVLLLGYAWLGRDLVVIALSLGDRADIADVLPLIQTGELMTLVFALLGLGGIRAYEGIRGVKRETLSLPTPRPGPIPATLPPATPDNGLEGFLAGLGVTVKPGVNLNGLDLPRVGPIFRAAAAEIPPPVVITSALRPHSNGSFHQVGRALDFRSKHIPAGERQAIAEKLRGRLSSGYDVLSEDNPPHFHIEADRV